ncbi:hypothetical protein RhiJN_10365 [Ceratobasidium sp. AG-Ba]|nr:hypothetical protein RhiJN_10365 [Ceratobasidium sp. AG-Ba]
MPKTPTRTDCKHRSLHYGQSYQRTRECPGCSGVFYRSRYLRHVRNDCGDMISVPELHAALHRQANETGSEVISFVEVAWIIQRLVAGRFGPYDLTQANNIPPEDLIDLSKIGETADAIAVQVQGEASVVKPDVNVVTTKVANMDL